MGLSGIGPFWYGPFWYWAFLTLIRLLLYHSFRGLYDIGTNYRTSIILHSICQLPEKVKFYAF